MNKHPIIKFIALHKQAKDNLRAGQRFCNLYVKSFDITTDPLYYMADEERALWLIREWLDDNHYTDQLPQKIER